jgi:vitamin B12 transporter
MLQDLPPDVYGPVIVVTGTALPDVADVHHVDVVGRSQLANAPAHELDTILLQVPGLQLFRRSDSTSGHPTSQGVTLRALGGNASSRALLILDGVPQADPFGGWVNWPAYDPAGLDSVRIVRGGGSVSQGPGALAGVINMQSRNEPGVDGSLQIGSRESIAGHIFLAEKLGEGLFALDGHGGRSDGFIPVTSATRGPVDRASPYSDAGIRGRFIAPIGGEAEVQLGGLAFVDKRDRGVAFTGNRTKGADLSVRFVGRGRWQWSALGYAQWRELRSSFASVDEDRATATRVSLQDSVPSRGFGGAVELRPPLGNGWEFRLGADARLTTGESRELYAYLAGEPTRRRVAGGRSASAGLFGELSYRHGPLHLSAGARLDHWRISKGRLVERLLAGGPPTRDDGYADRNGWRSTARVGAVFQIAKGTELRMAAYSGWRLPTLNELFRPFRAGADATAANALLGPEKLAGVEAGGRYGRGPFEIELSLFANRLSDAIANVTLGHGPGSFPGVGFVSGDYRQRQNIDAVNVRGVEASAGLSEGPWSLRLGASWTHARVDADGLALPLDGMRPAQTPNLVVIGALGWENESRTASLIVRHVGAQFEDDLNQHRLPAATTFDAFVAWPLLKRMQVIARAQNIFDEQVIAGIADDGTIERATPRTLWLGLRIASGRGADE